MELLFANSGPSGTFIGEGVLSEPTEPPGYWPAFYTRLFTYYL